MTRWILSLQIKKAIFLKIEKQVNKSHSTDFKVQIPVSFIFLFSLSSSMHFYLYSNLSHLKSVHTILSYFPHLHMNTHKQSLWKSFNVYHYFTAWLFQNLIFSVPYSRTVFFTIINNVKKNILCIKCSLNSVPYQKRNLDRA